MARSPAFQFYPRDFLADESVSLMSLEERGAYITLLCHAWNEGSIPASLDIMARLLHVDRVAMESVWPALRVAFSEAPEEGRLINVRLEKERLKQDEYHKNLSDAGKKGADKRWQGHRPPHKGRHASSSASSPASSPAGKPPTPLPFTTVGFTTAWEDWEEHRRQIRHAMTPLARTKALKLLGKLGDERAVAAIEHSIAQGYRGIYEPGQNGRAKPKTAREVIESSTLEFVDGDLHEHPS